MFSELWQTLQKSSNVISAISASVQALVIIVAAWLAIKQLRDGVRARSLAGFQAIATELNSDDERMVRAFVFSQPSLVLNQLPRDAQKKIEKVCVTFDFIGVLVYHNLVPRDVALSMYFDVVLRVWKKVHPFIAAERKKRNNNLYMLHFERLAKVCKKYHQRKFSHERLDYYFNMEPPGMYQQFIKSTLEKVNDIALTNFGRVSGVVKNDDPNQVLTETDLTIGRLLVAEIRANYPTHNIIDEEFGLINNDSDYTWVVDPIDGTSNFAAGVPLFGIMFGLLFVDRPIAGGIALPETGLICTAERGEGAWIAGERLKIADTKKLEDSLIAYGIDGNRREPELTRHECRFLAELILCCRNLRSSNSAFDAVMVAQGKYGAYLNQTSKIWDNVAPQVVIEEAGGVYTAFGGEPIDYRRPLSRIGENFTFCAAAPSVHSELQVFIHQNPQNMYNFGSKCV